MTLTREERYYFLCDLKRELSKDEEEFIRSFADEKLAELFEDPKIIAIFKRLKNR